jgi:hypothetical protein
MAVTINASTSAGLVTSADTSGDLNIQSGGSTKLAVTSAGAAITGTLTLNGTAVAGPDFTNNFVRLSGTDQTNSQDATTKYINEVEQEDANGWWNTGTHRFTPNKAGWYSVVTSYNQRRANAGTFQTEWLLYKNGSALNQIKSMNVSTTDRTNSTPGIINVTFLVYLNGTTDYLENYIYTYDYSGGSGQSMILIHQFYNWIGV